MASTSVPVAPEPLDVAWIGGSEVVLEDVSLPEVANQLGLEVNGRPLRFEGFTQIAASAVDSARRVEEALAAGADALIVTINPQWLYGRICEAVEPPHARYACLLEDGPVTGAADIAALGERIAAAGVPALLVMIPTSTTALDDPELGPMIVAANDHLEQLLATESSAPNITILDERLTAGREEYREGVGFHDMVHTTPSGAQQLAGEIAGELLRWLQVDR